jgi:hypothetical protein
MDEGPMAIGHEVTTHNHSVVKIYSLARAPDTITTLEIIPFSSSGVDRLRCSLDSLPSERRASGHHYHSMFVHSRFKIR